MVVVDAGVGAQEQPHRGRPSLLKLFQPGAEQVAGEIGPSNRLQSDFFSSLISLSRSNVCGLEGRDAPGRRARRSHESVYRLLKADVDAAVCPAVGVGDRGRHLEPGLQLLDVEVSSIEAADLRRRFQRIQPGPRLQSFKFVHLSHLLLVGISRSSMDKMKLVWPGASQRSHTRPSRTFMATPDS